MFTPSHQPSARQTGSTHHGLLRLAYTSIKDAAKNPTHSAHHSLFSRADKKYHLGAIVAAPSFDAELHIETTTIMFADVVESVRLIEQDEAKNVARIRALLRNVAENVVPHHHGTVLERRGDGLLIKFSDARLAVTCALKIHEVTTAVNVGVDSANGIALRVGAHCADVMSDGVALYGQGINLAARVASLAGPGETVVSEGVRDQLVVGLDADIFDIGECFLKHTKASLRAFRISACDSFASPVIPIQEQQIARPVIAVLPFRCFGMETNEVSLSIRDLVAENVIHLISRTDQLFVTSWLSSKAISDRNLSPNDVATALGANWLLAGSIYLDAGRLLINVELTQHGASHIEWTGRVRGQTQDLLAPESEIASEIAQSVIQRIVEVETKRFSKHALPNLASHSILTGAIGLMHRSGKDNFVKSRDALEYLLERHPRMHAVRPWLAQWYVLRNTRGFADDPQQDAARALEQTNRALDALPDDSRALALLGFTHFHILGDSAEAEKYLDMSIAINANDPLASIFCAAVKSVRQVVDEGWALSLQALTIAPYDPLRDYMLGMAAGCAMSFGRLDTAVELATASSRENANHPYAWRVLLIAHARLGNVPEARRAYGKLQALQQDLTISKYVARSKLHPNDLNIAIDALRIAGVPE